MLENEVSDYQKENYHFQVWQYLSSCCISPKCSDKNYLNKKGTKQNAKKKKVNVDNPNSKHMNLCNIKKMKASKYRHFFRNYKPIMLA